MKNKFFVVLIYLSFASSTHAHEAEYGYADLWKFCSMIDVEQGYPSSNRVDELKKNGKLKVSVLEFVDEWKGHFGVLHRRIPHMQPREKDWVDNEKENGRYLEVYKTLEFAKSEVEDWVHLNLTLLEQIKNTSGKERKYHLIHFGSRVSGLPAEHFNLLLKKGIISDFTQWDTSKKRLKGYEENYIPNFRYDMQNPLHSNIHYWVPTFIAKCFFARNVN